MLAFGCEEDLVSDRAAERAHPAAPQIGKRPQLLGVGCADAEHLVELIIRMRHRIRDAPRRRVLDAAEADLRVSAGDRLIDRGKCHLDELRGRPKILRDQLGYLDVEPGHLRRIGRVGLHVGRATLGVARPSKHRRRLRREPHLHCAGEQCGSHQRLEQLQ
jgi:hypothetical protein